MVVLAMINDQRTIEIKASLDKVFKQIETNPFPTYGMLNTKPFFFLRITLIDGIRTGIRLAFDKNLNREMTEPVALGSSLGPFILTEIERPSRYYFTLKSLFYNCITGFNLHSTDNGTLPNLAIIAEDPTFRANTWWFFVKPIHILLAYKVLKTIQKEVERNEVRL
jgi:hypothetical protein